MKRFSISLKNVAAIAACFAAITFTACDTTGGSEPDVPVASVAIEPPSATALSSLTAGGGTMTLAVKIEPANASDKTVMWSSSNTAVATVNSTGVVTGVSQGKATITATTKSGSKTAEFEVEVKPDPKAQPVELKSPIRENTTLKDLGMDIDYFYAGNNQLVVENNATLTIEPGVTIRFSHTGKYGGMIIKAGATIKAVGSASKRIKFIGTDNSKGSWAGISVETNSDNQFAYCDFVNAGNVEGTVSGGMRVYNAKVGFSYCTITGGLGYGLYFGSDAVTRCELTAFDHNVIEGFDNYPPLFIYTTGGLKLLEKMDMTSDLTKNAKPYIEIRPDMMDPVTINQASVPYYIRNTFWISYPLVINEGVTIYMESDIAGVQRNSTARLTVNGTASKKVKFTRLPGSTKYWYYINFNNRLNGCVINHCIFEYGGANPGNADDAIICITSDDVTVTEVTFNNVEIKNAQGYGAQIKGCNYIINHNNVTFSNNGSGNVNDRCPRPNAVIRPNFP